MSNKNKQVVLRIGNADPEEFIQQFKAAINETLILIFERRALDLEEGQMQALFILACASKYAKVVACP